jgi:hypothetical protein
VRGTGEALSRELSVWAGVVAEKPGDVRECARASPRRARGRRTDKDGPWRRERKEDARGNGSAASEPSLRDRERGRASGRRKLAPTGWVHWAARESARGRELPLTGGGGRSARDWAWWAGWAGWAAFPFSFSLDFLIPFLFLFL